MSNSHASDEGQLQPFLRYSLNSHGRDFVAGDIHGCFSALDDELAARGFDPGRDRLFSVGDLIDRSAQSAAVLDVVQRHDIKAVRGSHEQGILDWVLRDDIDPMQVRAVRGHRRPEGECHHRPPPLRITLTASALS